ncbi:MAG: 50S ribosomal protein L20, partial [Alistipes sp.]|nr:50S ribosomal protein L20 [Alistipes sp.]
FGSRGNVWTVAKNTVEKGLQFAYAHRREKKRNYRSLWIVRINAAVRMHGMTYSEFIGKMNAKGIALNRKVLADLALNEPKAFEAIVNAVK